MLELQKKKLELLQLQRDLAELDRELARGSDFSIRKVHDFLFSIEVLNSSIQNLRQYQSVPDQIVTNAENFLASMAQRLLIREESPSAISITSRYRMIVRKEISVLLFIISIFIISSLIGFAIVLNQPEYASLFIGSELVERILLNEAWFEEILQAPFLNGWLIAINNIKVAITVFAFSSLAGLGGIYILMINGLLLGAVVGFCHLNNFEDAILTFVVGHGPLELTLIIFSGFSGLLFGRHFFSRPVRTIPKRLKKGAGEAAVIIVVVATWLLLAAAIEVGVSPWSYVSPLEKAAIGVLAALLFFFWTFWPIDSIDQTRP